MSTAVDYRPLHGPRKEVSEDQMRETLKRRVREAAEKYVQVNGGSEKPQDSRGAVAEKNPPPTPASLSWEKPVRTTHDGQGYQRSTCGTFVIAKVRSGTEITYTASRCRPGEDAQVLGSRKTAAEAQALCQEAACR